MSRRPPLRIVEVGPRDGLQNEKSVVSTAVKVAFINRLSTTGLKEIEAGAFVRPDRVPQMADARKVFKRINRRRGVVYSALVPNERGLDAALEARADKIALFTAASETFNRRNINASIAESVERFRPVVRRAASAKLPLRAYISTAFWCPYEGRIPPRKALDVCLKLAEMGITELSIGDTIGKANPDEVRAFLGPALKKLKAPSIFLHFHDTYGMAVANALCAWEEFGISGFDSSAGGLGGCPYAPGASGNVATEDLLYAFKSSGGAVPAEPREVCAAARRLAPVLGHPLSSRLSRVLR